MDDHAKATLKRIETPLRLTWAGLWAERAVRAFWPLWTLAISLLAALSFGLQDHLPLEALWAGAVAAAVGLAAALTHGLSRFHRPTRTEALVRLDSRLPGQPLAALRDTQAIGATDPASRAVWAAHLARMAERAKAARPVEPNLKLAARDPFALRYIALTALVMALIFGSIWRLGSMAALAPGGASDIAADGPTWEGWLKPPTYTAKPTLYLNDQTAESLTLPVGTKLQLRLYGEPGSLILSETVSGRTEVPPASDAAQDFTITQSGKLAIDGAGGREWAVSVTPDRAPTIAADGPISRDKGGRFKQKVKGSDDYGITKATVTIALDLAQVDRRFGLALEPEDLAPVVLDLPMPRKGKREEFAVTLVDDLSQSVLANMPVTLTFAAVDAAGQQGNSAPTTAVLPGKRFFDPAAAALIELRRDLLWTRANAPRVVQILRALTHKPEGFFTNRKAFLRLRVAMKRLEADAASLTPALRDEVAEELWQIALLMEEGDLNDARERLKRAQDRLAEAIKRGASPEEIQELMDEMRQAMDDYMDMLAETMEERTPEEQSADGGATMSEDQLQEMLDRLQKLMEEGKTAEAAELLAQIQEMMENMRMVQGDGQGGKGRGSPGQQAMRDLGETLRGQQGLSDDAFRDMQRGRQGEAEGDGQQGEQPGGEKQSLAERQEALRRELERLERQGNLPGKGGDRGEAGRQSLDNARRAMREAEDALRDEDLPGALDRQAEALEALRDGIRDFGEALAQENRQEGQRQAGAEARQDDPEGRDPLGRQTGESLRIGSDDNLLSDKEVYRRAEELLEEIRRRSGDLARPEGERDYLKRLLDLF
ncbi:TIGR02302 family protein [Tabrizicola oligotrophica]|uniref:TIGR02302 family protein n=1 Tax=Tabrizicola oligotrophica TaxID=2710650 RepID=A0A6M0QST2_9RHOB|nr:TIGR02302 family protein [Tabrizicola oligotrophica]NEY90515.1 TIGR02302 family protein [Tabrizicola oligotrophica]